MPRPSKNRRPKHGLRGVSCFWTGQRWKYRAIIRRNGKQIPGKYRSDPYEAHEDYLELRAKLDALDHSANGNGHAVRRPRATLREALDQNIARARERGASEYYLRAQLGSVARFLCSYLGARVPIAKIGVDDVIRFVRQAREGGRHDNTIIDKDLLLLDQAFRAVGVPSPVPAAKKALTTLRRKKVTPKAMSFDDVRALIAKIRASDPEDFPAAQSDADIFELVAYTGIRAGELSRITADAIDLEKCAIHVHAAKNRARPRSLSLPIKLLPLLERLKARAEQDPRKLLIPGGMGTAGTMCAKWKARLEEPRLSLRMLRASLASALATQGIAVVDVSKILGHTSTSTTDRYLASLLEADRLRRALEVLDGEEHHHS